MASCHLDRMSTQSCAVFSFKFLFFPKLQGTASITSSEQPAIVYGFDLGEPGQLLIEAKNKFIVDHHTSPTPQNPKISTFASLAACRPTRRYGLAPYPVQTPARSRWSHLSRNNKILIPTQSHCGVQMLTFEQKHPLRCWRVTGVGSGLEPARRIGMRTASSECTMTSIRQIEINDSNADGSTSQSLTGTECSQFRHWPPQHLAQGRVQANHPPAAHQREAWLNRPQTYRLRLIESRSSRPI